MRILHRPLTGTSILPICVLADHPVLMGLTIIASHVFLQIQVSLRRHLETLTCSVTTSRGHCTPRIFLDIDELGAASARHLRGPFAKSGIIAMRILQIFQKTVSGLKARELPLTAPNGPLTVRSC
ncbi:hypothetical protein BKA67DRAFT_45447 [Truncatella angustata]|uniref:Uncharacterized protein n=1 Tax=Truncatella angustata TaxID=152316 RepID=A0A9P9A229_9PEZI|nr:uncharacterized protein BKA67DRAFT_45447 [Truncatella angustata]KAH6660241.1 hypothetical protein BKA67DRAFT_45447 [Truncatella angustata]